MATTDHGDEIDRGLRAAEAALACGRALSALDPLVDLDRRRFDPRVARLLVELRHAAFDELDRTPGRTSWPPTLPDPFPGHDGLPRSEPEQLSGEVLGGALVHHGCLRIDGLVSDAGVAVLRDHIDRSFAARARVVDDGAPPESAAPWFVPFAPGRAKAGGFGSEAFVRVVDAPTAMGELVAAFAAAGVTRAVTDYFGERPAMIANKWILRRSPSGKAGTDYHQDGAFLGEGIRTVDCWISLSDCGPGTGRPGIDLVPRRFPILDAGEGAAFPWSLTEETVHEAASGALTHSPVFAPGDALFFDEHLPHRTSVGLDLTTRHAIESWFVAPSSYPSKHVPVVL